MHSNTLTDHERTEHTSPVIKYINEDWGYGFGNWFECHAPSFNCTTRTRVSSPGAYGAYPFIDYQHKYFGILARQGELNTFPEGYSIFKEVEAQIIAWSEAHQ